MRCTVPACQQNGCNQRQRYGLTGDTLRIDAIRPRITYYGLLSLQRFLNAHQTWSPCVTSEITRGHQPVQQYNTNLIEAQNMSVFRAPVCALLICLIFPQSTRSHTQSIEDDARPNIIYIMVDDLGYGDLGCFGQKIIQTPNIDRLASEGMKLTNHYAGHTVCRPSRLVLWTGQHVGHTGLTGNRPRSLTSTEPTVARLLQESGYTTGGVGKWALGHVERPEEIKNSGHPNLNGFDYWFGYMNQGNAHNFYPTFLWENDRQVTLPGNVLDPSPAARGRVSSRRVSYSHDFMTEAALNFVRNHHDVPFLLHIHWTIPHANNEGGRLTGDGMEIPSHGIYADRDWPNPEKGFAAMITYMDRDVGRLMQLLKQLEIENETLVIFTSDNGPHNEGGHSHEYFDSNGQLTGIKRSMHEGGIRVPTIARWPHHIVPDTISDHPSAFYDFLPTACELAGVRPPAKIDGISYLPTLLGRPAEQEKHEYLYFASEEGETSVGVRYGNWKLVKYGGNNTEPGSPQDWKLYNLVNDTAEQRDISAVHTDVTATILGLLKRDGLLHE
ncbi:MAG: arylsulfatase [Fuerstiella sp.]|nr:arylsulfatase [Fuerstiella sp.]